MKRLLALALAACQAHAAPVLVSNRTSRPDRVALRGHARELPGRDALVGATIVATSTELRGEAVVITDETGAYAFPDLPAGAYTLTVYYADVTFTRAVDLGRDRTLDTWLEPDPTRRAKVGGCIAVRSMRPVP